MLTVREARESDVEAIRDLFVASYEQRYPYQQYYDLDALKKLAYADNSILLVAEEDGRLLGTASVVMHVGAYNDLVGEFGRLTVHPEARGRGVGQLLMQGRIERVQQRLHVGLVENRTAHPYSQKISAKFGFACAGFLPSKLLTDRRESVALYVRYFGHALKLRRNHPRIISEAVAVAELSMRNLGIEPDAIVDVTSAPYALDDSFELKQFNTEGYSTLLRLERGRVHDREIVGPLRLHYGLFQLRARDSTYLMAGGGPHLAGAVGFARDPVERTVRVFELVSASERPIRFLLEKLLLVCRDSQEVDYIEIDVNAHAPRMQRTLLELGFLPCAYVPALTFHQVERLDVVKMVRVLGTPDFSGVVLAESSAPMAEIVIRQFAQSSADPRIVAAAGHSPLFAGLNSEQTRHLAREFTLKSFSRDEVIFTPGQPAGQLYLVIDGAVEIAAPDDGRRIALLTAGQCLGERSLMTHVDHAVAARTISDAELAVLEGQAMESLIRRRPDIGVVLYRNLARELAEKL